MKLFIWTFACCCLMALASVGQIDAQSAEKHVIIKFAPLALVDFDNAIQFGVEVPLGKGISVQQDLGYGPKGINGWQSTSDNPAEKQTFKSRTNLRYYYLERRRMKPYVSAELLLKRVIYSQNKWVGMECSERWGPCNYFENKMIKTRRMVGAGHAKAGMQFYFSSRIALDLFAGVGFRSIKVRSMTSLPGNVRVPRNDNWFENDTPGTNEFIPSLSLGAHIGFILGKFDH